MNKPKPITVTVRAAALVGAFSLLAVATTQAAFTNLPFPTAETPGVSLGAFQATGGGTVLAVKDSPFVDNASPTPFTSGTVRSFVVDRGGGLLDFYYQLVNTSTPPPDGIAEFFRMNIQNGFAPSSILSVAQTASTAGLVAGAGSGFVAGSYALGSAKPAATADRGNGEPADVGFDFPSQPPTPFIGNAQNIRAGEESGFLVVRTNTNYFGLVDAAVSGPATGYAQAFAAVPEPSSVLFGLAMLGVTLNSRIKSRRAKAA